MMGQERQKDRVRALDDDRLNLKVERESRHLHEKLDPPSFPASGGG